MEKESKTLSNLHIKIGFAIMLLILAISMGIAFVSYYGSTFAEQTTSSASSASSDSSGTTASNASSDVLVEGKNITKQMVLECMDTGLASAFKTLTDDEWKKLASRVETLSEEMNIESSQYRQSLSTQTGNKDRYLITAVLTQEATEKEMFSGDAQIVVDAYRKYALTVLQENEKKEYDDSTYSRALSMSEQFANLYGNATKAELNQVILYTGSKTRFNFKNPVLDYNGTLMASIDDLYQYVVATCSRTPNSATISIDAPIRVEMTAGENQAYINDRSAVMTVPVLYVNGLYYIPIEFFATANKIAYSKLKEQGANPVIILYNDLNQLENSTQANVLNTSSLKASSSSQSSGNASKSSSSSSDSSSR